MTHVVIKCSCFVSLFPVWLPTFKTWLSFVSCSFSWISRCRNSNNKIDGAKDLLTQGSIASGGPLTQRSVASGWNETVLKVVPFF